MSSNIQQLLTDNPTVGSLNDITMQHNSEYLLITNYMLKYHSQKYLTLYGPSTIYICPSRSSKQLFLDQDQVTCLKVTYETMHKYQFTNTSVSFVATKHSRIKIGHNTLGSQSSCSKRCSYTLQHREVKVVK